MSEKKARRVKAAVLGALWLAIRIPTNLALLRCGLGADVIGYALTIQVTDAIIVAWLSYRMWSLAVREPHTCPVCKGFGRHHYFGGGKELKATAEVCNACRGTGIVWQPLHGQEGEESA